MFIGQGYLTVGVSYKNKFYANLPYINKRIQMTSFDYSTPKRQSSSSQPQANIKNRLDDILRSDYNELRKQTPQDLDYSKLAIKSSNTLILDYVKGIYEEYNIPDPLPQAVKKYETPTRKKLPKKIYINMCSSRTKKYQSPKIEQSQYSHLQSSKMMEAGHRKQSDFVETENTIKRQRQLEESVSYRASMSYFDASYHDRQDEEPRLNKSSAVRIEKQKLTPASLEKLDRPLMPNRPFGEQSLVVHNAKLSISLAYDKRNRRSNTLLQSPQVNESFRYCVGCQRALLHVNIQTHQKICQQFQQVFQMTPVQIVQHLCKKIEKFEASVRQQCKELQNNDAEKLTSHSHLVLEQSRAIVGNGIMTENYQHGYKQAMQIGSKWCVITQQINQIHWFLKIRQGIKKKFDL